MVASRGTPARRVEWKFHREFLLGFAETFKQGTQRRRHRNGKRPIFATFGRGKCDFILFEINAPLQFSQNIAQNLKLMECIIGIRSFVYLIVGFEPKDFLPPAVLLGKGRYGLTDGPDDELMTNGTLGQVPAVAPAPANTGYPYGDGIQFDEDVWTPEEEDMEVIKRKILEKLLVRLEPANVSRIFRDAR